MRHSLASVASAQSKDLLFVRVGTLPAKQQVPGLRFAWLDRDAGYKLPVRIWKEMMDVHYPNTAWLCLQRDAFDRLAEYKARNNIASSEQALERALGLAAEAKA